MTLQWPPGDKKICATTESTNDTKVETVNNISFSGGATWWKATLTPTEGDLIQYLKTSLLFKFVLLMKKTKTNEIKIRNSSDSFRKESFSSGWSP